MDEAKTTLSSITIPDWGVKSTGQAPNDVTSSFVELVLKEITGYQKIKGDYLKEQARQRRVKDTAPAGPLGVKLCVRRMIPLPCPYGGPVTHSHFRKPI